MVDQEETPAAPGVGLKGQVACPLLGRQAPALILHLPNQPTGRENPAHPQAFTRVIAIAMANRIDQHFLEPQLQGGNLLAALDRFQQ